MHLHLDPRLQRRLGSGAPERHHGPRGRPRRRADHIALGRERLGKLRLTSRVHAPRLPRGAVEPALAAICLSLSRLRVPAGRLRGARPGAQAAEAGARRGGRRGPRHHGQVDGTGHAGRGVKDMLCSREERCPILGVRVPSLLAVGGEALLERGRTFRLRVLACDDHRKFPHGIRAASEPINPPREVCNELPGGVGPLLRRAPSERRGAPRVFVSARTSSATKKMVTVTAT